MSVIASRFTDTLAAAGAQYAGIIGVCGGIACGKSTALTFLSSRSEVPVICVSADAFGHAAYAPGGPAHASVAALFPSAVGDGGVIDRAALGAAVFNDSAARAALNAAVWPAVAELVLNEFKERAIALRGVATTALPPPVGVLEAALLVEAGWASQCDSVWLLSVSRETAISRVLARGGGADREAASRRVDAQPDAAARLAAARAAGVLVDAEFDTGGSIQDTQARMEAPWLSFLSKCKSR